MKVFISQPMAGRSESVIIGEREKIKLKLAERFGDDFSILESYFQEEFNPQDKRAGLRLLSKALWLLAEADIAYFAKGWQNARGCRIEHECARMYGITIIEEGD